MNNENSCAQLKRFEIPGRLSVIAGNGQLPKLVIQSQWSTAEVYLHGAHVTSFQKTGEAPLLFMSQSSLFTAGKPIRGGIPVILPWFGARDNMPMHGFARLASWELHEASALPDGGVSVRLSLPKVEAAAAFPSFMATYVVTVTDKLAVELIVTNTSNQELTLEDCLHTYFQVGNISDVSVTGLKGSTYLDKVADFAAKQETGEAIRFASEVDRVYLNAAGETQIVDTNLKRRIRIAKSGSDSTVVWNPWIAKAKQMPDFGDQEYLQMVCVESGNVNRNHRTLAPGRSSALKVVLSSEGL